MPLANFPASLDAGNTRFPNLCTPPWLRLGVGQKLCSATAPDIKPSLPPVGAYTTAAWLPPNSTILPKASQVIVLVSSCTGLPSASQLAVWVPSPSNCRSNRCPRIIGQSLLRSVVCGSSHVDNLSYPYLSQANKTRVHETALAGIEDGRTSLSIVRDNLSSATSRS